MQVSGMKRVYQHEIRHKIKIINFNYLHNLVNGLELQKVPNIYCI